ncbi:MAG: hypothetical protein A2289_01360 [Deltaproteobacteria bacterium RIFOXYA12_FULL_58_15]|nr:MAG: hypothetical protein A2289_01360 [Deltaproteobacteria bacterium RIFOXYA12_FULL_58_15]OGR14036.1 MAG: hypothetical protein A2341_19015 [Deltaproteobacteria bacterium RIFOXYB12_FULL_58_9]
MVMTHDHGGTRDPQAETHLQGCVTCQTFARNLQGLDGLLLADTPDQVRPGFDTRFFARLNEQRKQPARRWHLWHLVAPLTGAVAAGVLGVILLAGPRTAPDLGDDLEVAMHLEMLEDLEVISNLEDTEAFEILAKLDEDDLRTLLTEEEMQ